MHDSIGLGRREGLRRGWAGMLAVFVATGCLAVLPAGCASDEPPKSISREDQAAIRERAGEDQMDLDENIDREEERQQRRREE